ncbi:(2Fe-2S)-binding protein [Streptomyces resistomycificus]|uniref:Iron-sulfur protein n=1 Tax=Streptomyces resistomycificus TaxID=67356 RepID=A0A0L8LWX5_9ACTN|nr:(2Fe-2S)-binding protein [Streptomyces resistomycificus]KOG42604.1 iron-sulfur protein [Streptomyces resistomycificus]KUN92757.1 iron-sulfur protein [Streptomyces resistomycificus]
MSVAVKTPPDAAVERALGDLYRRLADVCEALTVRVAEPGEDAARAGVTAAELMTDQDALAAFVEAESARIEDRYGVRARPDVAASRALHDYAWTVGVLTGGAWYLERRVPRIRPEDLRLDLASGVYTITPGSDVACLADDSLAVLPGVMALPQQEHLRAALRMALADHMRPLLAAIGPTVRRGARTLWGMVSDDLVSGIWYLGRMLGQEGDALRAATEVLPAPVPPYPTGADFRHLVGDDGRRHATRTRAGCCMFYAIRPAEACVTCPRTRDPERLRRLES